MLLTYIEPKKKYADIFQNHNRMRVSWGSWLGRFEQRQTVEERMPISMQK